MSQSRLAVIKIILGVKCNRLEQHCSTKTDRRIDCIRSQSPYENLTDEDFEALVIRIGKEILGIGCKTFSIGKDGAKDSWFTGTANYFPSNAAHWTGTFNLQAKHTKVHNASCSDNDFSVNQTSFLVKEINRLNEVGKNTPFDNYMDYGIVLIRV